ncbi:MAG TPA: hypothetical protein VMR75_00385, partial [Candidatus Saccharimonadales bacterium]|nr:hypothetical protein [Candidatus Saccharimonadales bacterium]
IWSNPTFSLRQYALIAGGLLVLAGGIVLLAATASPSASLTADNGTLTSGASIQSSTAASDGKGYVEFGGSGSGATINPAPDGVPAPSGGWSVEYADAFNAPILGTTQANGFSGTPDNTWYPNRGNNCNNTAGFNNDEMEAFSCSAVSVNPATGLTLLCSHTGQNTVMQSGDDPANYTCGTVEGSVGATAGYKFFGFKPGEGQEWAVQINSQLPPNTGEADPGWWATGPPWTEELDFYEEFGGSAGCDGTWTTSNTTIKSPASCVPANGWIGGTDPTWIWNEGISGQGQISANESLHQTAGFDPSAGFHTYTTVFFPNGSFSEYIDGKIQTWDYVPTKGSGYVGCTATGTPPSCGTVNGPPAVNNNDYIQLLLSYALRDDTDGDPDPYFTSGTRNFNIRSVAVYENTTANGANASGTGLAPGTTVK